MDTPFPENVRIGICSWTDRTLLKSGFYPSGASTPASRLAFYAGCFDVVEVDSSFYVLLDAGRAFRWIAGTPKDFLFGVKSFAIFTFHRAKYASLPFWLQKELGPHGRSDFVRRGDLSPEQRRRLFEEFVEPLRVLQDSGRLAYLLFQFPPNWRYGRESLAYIRRLREVCGPLPIALEVRNRSWLEAENVDRFVALLREENIAYVAVDEPRLGWTVPPEWPFTAEWGTLVRFHGRNEVGWRNPRATVHERFDYEYGPSELEEWKPRVDSAAKVSKSVYLMYNNCVGDKAVRAARLMTRILGGTPREAHMGQTSLGFPVPV